MSAPTTLRRRLQISWSPCLPGISPSSSTRSPATSLGGRLSCRGLAASPGISLRPVRGRSPGTCTPKSGSIRDDKVAIVATELPRIPRDVRRRTEAARRAAECRHRFVGRRTQQGDRRERRQGGRPCSCDGTGDARRSPPNPETVAAPAASKSASATSARLLRRRLPRVGDRNPECGGPHLSRHS